MVNTLALRVEDRGLDLRSGLTKGYKIGICYFSAKQATFWSKSKDGVARNQSNVFE
jgi:ribulose bisphosphate carboxylase small subunit